MTRSPSTISDVATRPPRGECQLPPVRRQHLRWTAPPRGCRGANVQWEVAPRSASTGTTDAPRCGASDGKGAPYDPVVGVPGSRRHRLGEREPSDLHLGSRRPPHRAHRAPHQRRPRGLGHRTGRPQPGGPGAGRRRQRPRRVSLTPSAKPSSRFDFLVHPLRAGMARTLLSTLDLGPVRRGGQPVPDDTETKERAAMSNTQRQGTRGGRVKAVVVLVGSLLAVAAGTIATHWMRSTGGETGASAATATRTEAPTRIRIVAP